MDICFSPGPLVETSATSCNSLAWCKGLGLAHKQASCQPVESRTHAARKKNQSVCLCVRPDVVEEDAWFKVPPARDAF